MAEKDHVLKEKLDYNGLFNYSGFYNFAYAWLKYEDYDVIEDEYSEKVSGDSKEVTIKWKASKSISDYFKIEHTIKIEIKGMTEVEVEIEGKKKKMNKAKITIEIKGVLIRDKDSNWYGGWQWKFFREVYDKYIVPGRILDMTLKVMEEVRLFKEQLKNYLEISAKRQY